MMRAWLAAAAIAGFLSVAAGAAAAHFTAGDRTAELLRTGALYGMVHAAALIAVTAMAARGIRPSPPLIFAGWGFAVGTLLFALSLFALALTRSEVFAWATPFGGIGLLIGWAALGWQALRRP
jgi:uncharacterized membrane protein YgdD (TMEM256/DUF423 family)